MPFGLLWKPLSNEIWDGLKKINIYLIYLYQTGQTSIRFNLTDLILVIRQLDNPIKSTSLNFNSIFTGLMAPCLIPIFGMWSGSIGIILIPGCPPFKTNRIFFKKMSICYKNILFFIFDITEILTLSKEFNKNIRNSYNAISIASMASFDVFC